MASDKSKDAPKEGGLIGGAFALIKKAAAWVVTDTGASPDSPQVDAHAIDWTLLELQTARNDTKRQQGPKLSKAFDRVSLRDHHHHRDLKAEREFEILANLGVGPGYDAPKKK